MTTWTGLGWGGWTRRVFCCIAVLMLAWVSARFVLRLAEPAREPSSATVPSAAGTGLAPESERGPDARQTFVPLFGTTAAGGAKQTAPAAQTPAYALRGIFESPGGGDLAIIESSGTTAVYDERERLPGGETIAAIDRDGITIEGARGSARIALEELRAPDAGLAQRPPPPSGRAPAAGDRETGPLPQAAGLPLASGSQDAARQAPGARESEGTEATAAHVEPERRPALSSDALTRRLFSTDALSAAMRVRRVRARGGRIGLRIQWLREDEVADAIGLRRGDVILAVNGQAVDDPETLDGLRETLSKKGEVVIELERRDGLHRLVIPLSHG